MGIRSNLKDFFGDDDGVSKRVEDIKDEATKALLSATIKGIDFTQSVLKRMDKTAEEVLETSKEKASKLKNELEEQTKGFRQVAEEQFDKTKDYVQDKLHEADKKVEEVQVEEKVDEKIDEVKKELEN